MNNEDAPSLQQTHSTEAKENASDLDALQNSGEEKLIQETSTTADLPDNKVTLTINEAWEEQDYVIFDDNDIKNEYDLLADAPEVVLDESDPLSAFFKPIPERPSSQRDVKSDNEFSYSASPDGSTLNKYEDWDYAALSDLDKANQNESSGDGVDIGSKESEDSGSIRQSEENDDTQFGEGQEIGFENNLLEGDGQGLESEHGDNLGKVQTNDNLDTEDKMFSEQNETNSLDTFGEVKNAEFNEGIDKNFSSAHEENSEGNFGELDLQEKKSQKKDKDFLERSDDAQDLNLAMAQEANPIQESDLNPVQERINGNNEIDKNFSESSETQSDELSSVQFSDAGEEKDFSEIKQNEEKDSGIFSKVNSQDQFNDNNRSFSELPTDLKSETFTPVQQSQLAENLLDGGLVNIQEEENINFGEIRENSPKDEFSSEEITMENVEEQDDTTSATSGSSKIVANPVSGETELLVGDENLLFDPSIDEKASIENQENNEGSTPDTDDLLFANPIEENDEQQKRKRPRPKKRKRFSEDEPSESEENKASEEAKNAETTTVHNENSGEAENSDNETDPEKKGRRKRARRRFFTDSDEIEAFENREKKQSPLLHINSVLPIEGLGGERIKIRYIPPPPEKDRMVPFLIFLMVILPAFFGGAATYFFFLPESSMLLANPSPSNEKKNETAVAAKDNDENIANLDDSDHPKSVESEKASEQEEEEGMIASFRQLKINFVDGYPKTENNSIRYHLLKGRNKMMMENNDGALLDFKAALELDQQDPEALLTLAECYRSMKDNLSALKYLEALRETHPELLITYLRIGNIFADEGRVGDARDMFNFYLVKNNIGVYASEAKEALKNLKGK